MTCENQPHGHQQHRYRRRPPPGNAPEALRGGRHAHRRTGFSATTVDEIAERAGVAKGTVYYNFASKNELFEELLRHGVGLLTVSLRTAAEETEQRGGSRVEALDAMIRAGLVFIDRYPAFTQLYVAELWRTNRAWQSTLMVVRQEAVAVVETVLREGVERGSSARRSTCR